MIELFVSIAKSDELADPVGIELDVFWRGKTTGNKEFPEVRQYLVIH